MCLDYVYGCKEKKEKLAKLPDEFTVWKVLISAKILANKLGVSKEMSGSKYVTDCLWSPVYAGEVKFKQNVIDRQFIYECSQKYKGGGHFFLTKEGAAEWCSEKDKIVKCKVKKEDINNIGTQNGYEIVVVKKATFPKYVGKRRK